MLISAKFALSCTSASTGTMLDALFKLAFGCCVVICLPQIHSELAAAIIAKCIHYDLHWLLWLEQGNTGQFGDGRKNTITIP